MRLNTPVALALIVGAVSNALPAPQSSIPSQAASDDTTAAEQMAQLAQYAQEQVNSTLTAAASKRGGCNIHNVAVRKEWGALTNKERKSYTDAVKCLQKKQAKTPSSLVPGAKSRFDDWVATHINQTMTIHYTGTFLAWHRYFTWSYEQALRNECGYTGYQPYWDWAKTAKSGLANSSMLDGSEYSMSGDGEFIPGRGNVIIGGNGLPEIPVPAGSGGGCVKSGPFKDMKVNLGPAALQLTDGTTIANGDGLSYNPRCLKRDLTDYANRRWATAPLIVDLILKNKIIYDFQMVMQGVPGSGEIGVHGGGKSTPVVRLSMPC